MSSIANRSEVISITGDITYSQTISAAPSIASPASIDIYSLAGGTNTIALPSGGSTPKAAILIPPAGNAVVITLKAIAGDTGLPISKTEPYVMTFDAPPPTNFVLNCVSAVVGFKIIWL